MLIVLHGNDGVHTHNRGSKDILGATTHYTPFGYIPPWLHIATFILPLDELFQGSFV